MISVVSPRIIQFVEEKNLLGESLRILPDMRIGIQIPFYLISRRSMDCRNAHHELVYFVSSISGQTFRCTMTPVKETDDGSMEIGFNVISVFANMEPRYQEMVESFVFWAKRKSLHGGVIHDLRCLLPPIGWTMYGFLQRLLDQIS